jgi:hypothetical protein
LYTWTVSFWYPLGITVKKVLKKLNLAILKMKWLPPKMESASSHGEGVITLGNVPSKYTGKFLLGFKDLRMPPSWGFPLYTKLTSYRIHS